MNETQHFTLKGFQWLKGHNPSLSWSDFSVKHLQEVLSFIHRRRIIMDKKTPSKVEATGTRPMRLKNSSGVRHEWLRFKPFYCCCSLVKEMLTPTTLTARTVTTQPTTQPVTTQESNEVKGSSTPSALETSASQTGQFVIQVSVSTQRFDFFSFIWRHDKSSKGNERIQLESCKISVNIWDTWRLLDCLLLR